MYTLYNIWSVYFLFFKVVNFMINKKDFEKWNNMKQELHYSDKKVVYAKAWEIWYINMWINIWFESIWKWDRYKRPVLVVKKLWKMFLCISMTTKWKDNIFYYKLDDKYFNKSLYIVLSQVKSNDSKRFVEKIWELSHKDFYKIKKNLKNFWF